MKALGRFIYLTVALCLLLILVGSDWLVIAGIQHESLASKVLFSGCLLVWTLILGTMVAGCIYGALRLVDE